MDFRDRFPNIKYWPSAAADRCHSPFPYCKLFFGGLLEFPAPDDSTSFLVIPHFDEPEGGGGGQFFCYGVEAPQGYPLRTQFELGRVSWTDFMSHRNWLIELTSQLFDQGPCRVRYLTPLEIHPACKAELRELDSRGGPLQILHDHLRRNYEAEKTWTRKSTKSEDAYFEFLAKYGEILGVPAIKIA